MKRIFAILMTICLLAGALSITAFAAEELPAPAEGTLIRVTAIKGEDTVLIGDYTNFEDGWHKAIHEGLPAQTKKTKYERIIVDFYADWTSADDGNFTDDPAMQLNSEGFNNDTIEIPDDVKITINLGGHTIKRVLPDSISDGEVMYIDEDADVIINNGTITGGKSTNGAGGIHIHDANVTLNDVHIVGNIADNDDGGGIALYDDAVLVMNGGSFQNNSIDGVAGQAPFDCYGGAIYIEDSIATFNGVTFKNNYATSREECGVAIYADDSEVYLSDCIFDGNGLADESKNICAGISIVHAEDSELVMEKVTFINNGAYYLDANGYMQTTNTGLSSTLIALDDAILKLSKDSKFTNNATCFMISIADDSSYYVSDTTFTDNKSFVLYAFMNKINDDSYFEKCIFNNNVPSDMGDAAFTGQDNWNKDFAAYGTTLKFIECDMGNSTYSEYPEYEFDNCKNAPKQIAGVRRFGSIFGEGSLTMIVALLALIASGVAIFLTVYYNKKKAAPVAVDVKEAEDEE